MSSILNLLRDPFWQGIGVIFAIVFGFLGFYYNGKNKLWLYVAGFVLTFIVGLTSGTAIQAITSEAVTNNLVPMAIDSAKDWQSTSINLKRGDIIEIHVEGGQWSTAKYEAPGDNILPFLNNALKKINYPQGEGIRIYMHKETNANGDKLKECDKCPLDSANLGSLIGRIGGSQPFVVGKEISFIAADEGLLQLRINDSTTEGYLNDNSGLLSVTVKKNSDKKK